jgi:hypothetical protein
MSLISFFKKHQKKILLLLIILVVLFLLNRYFKILEGLETKEEEKKGGALADASAIKSLDDLKQMMASAQAMANK